MRIFWAFFLAPLTTPIVFVVLTAFRLGSLEPITILPWAMMVYAPFAYAAAGILGLPAYWILRRYAEFTLSVGIVIGGVIGLLTAVFVGIFVSPHMDAFAFLSCTVAGSAAAVVFWWIIRFDEPNGRNESEKGSLIG